jgi:hypothetical protein
MQCNSQKKGKKNISGRGNKHGIGSDKVFSLPCKPNTLWVLPACSSLHLMNEELELEIEPFPFGRCDALKQNKSYQGKAGHRLCMPME